MYFLKILICKVKLFQEVKFYYNHLPWPAPLALWDSFCPQGLPRLLGAPLVLRGRFVSWKLTHLIADDCPWTPVAFWCSLGPRGLPWPSGAPLALGGSLFLPHPLPNGPPTAAAGDSSSGGGSGSTQNWNASLTCLRWWRRWQQPYGLYLLKNPRLDKTTRQQVDKTRWQDSVGKTWVHELRSYSCCTTKKVGLVWQWTTERLACIFNLCLLYKFGFKNVATSTKIGPL